MLHFGDNLFLILNSPLHISYTSIMSCLERTTNEIPAFLGIDIDIVKKVAEAYSKFIRDGGKRRGI